VARDLARRPRRDARHRRDRLRLYLTNISSIARLGTTLIFIVIVLIWFYVLAIIVLGGAVINAARFEIYDTGDLKIGGQGTGDSGQG